MKSVLVFQHDREDPLGLLGKILREYNIAYHVIDVTTENIVDPGEYQACIALGGFQHVYEYSKYHYCLPEKEALRTIIKRQIPYLGICLGAQLLADVLGGTVKQHTMVEIGFYDVQFTERGKSDPLYEGLPCYQKVFHWHEDTFDLPPEALLLATSENTMHQAFRYGNAYGLQYHIELDTEMLDRWLLSPEAQHDIVKRIGSNGYNLIKHERSLYYQTYQTHTRILFENFLKMNRLI